MRPLFSHTNYWHSGHELKPCVSARTVSPNVSCRLRASGNYVLIHHPLIISRKEESYCSDPKIVELIVSGWHV